MKKLAVILSLCAGLFLLLQKDLVHGAVLIPENTTCKKITTKHVEVLPFEGEDPGITRACIGWAPNFPSTRVEGGQGTYFYFAYKLFPTPMPAYKVTTYDKLGLGQSFELSEPEEKLGACNPKIASDEECKMYEPFLYYPARWEDRFKNDELEEFRGPYTVGPHEFYHYRYRGRMVPQQISFHFDVIDMTGQSANIPKAKGTIVYDVPDECHPDHIIDIAEDCRLIEFYIPTDGRDHRSLPGDSNVGEVPTDRILFLNPGEHTFRVEVDEKQMYRYQVDEGEEWQGKEKVYRKRWVDDDIPKPTVERKFIEMHRYDEGAFTGNKNYDPVTRTGVGGWCKGYLPCSLRPEGVRMHKTYAYNRDGWKGTLKEINEVKSHVLTEGSPSDYQYYNTRTMNDPNNPNHCYTATPVVGATKGIKQTYCDENGVGYDYFQRGIFIDRNGKVTRSGWRSHHAPRTFPGWEGNLNTLHPDFFGYEWRRFQILSGWVERKVDPNAPSTGESSMMEYMIGPVSTHTTRVKESNPPEIEWVNQDEYKNHCYSEEDAFSKTGEWDEETPMPNFNEIDSPAIVCFHNHSDDFHYWKYDWSEVRKFGGDTREGLLY